MNKVKELFGLHTGRNDIAWKKILRDQHCSYTNKKCSKVRKSNPDVSIGVCTVEYGRHNEVMICPQRQVFADCVHLLSLHEPGNELHLVPEVTVPGGIALCLGLQAKAKIELESIKKYLEARISSGTIFNLL